MNEQRYQPGETDAFKFVKEELAQGRSVTIWPVEDQAHILAAISEEQGM